MPKHAVESPANQDLGALTPESGAVVSAEGEIAVPEEPVVIVEPLPNEQSSDSQRQDESPITEVPPVPIIDSEPDSTSESQPEEDIKPQPETKDM